MGAQGGKRPALTGSRRSFAGSEVGCHAYRAASAAKCLVRPIPIQHRSYTRHRADAKLKPYRGVNQPGDGYVFVMVAAHAHINWP
jgi:hypothetical protein